MEKLDEAQRPLIERSSHSLNSATLTETPLALNVSSGPYSRVVHPELVAALKTIAFNPSTTSVDSEVRMAWPFLDNGSKIGRFLINSSTGSEFQLGRFVLALQNPTGDFTVGQITFTNWEYSESTASHTQPGPMTGAQAKAFTASAWEALKPQFGGMA